MFVLFGFVAFAVDMGLARVQVRQDQTAADAAALAAVGVLNDGGTRGDAASAAIRISWENLKGTAPNLADWTNTWQSCSDSSRDTSIYTVTATAPVSTSCISFKDDNSRVRIRIPTVNVDSQIAKLIGVDSIGTAAAAEAISEGTATGNFAVFGISETCSDDFAVTIKGGTNIPEGAVHSNNDLRIENPHNIPDGASYRTALSAPGNVSATQVAAMADPLGHIDMADYRPGGDKALAAGSAYHDFTGVQIKNSNITTPGLYYTDQKVTVTSGITINATFIIDNPTLTGSGFDSNGTGYNLSFYDDEDSNPDKLLIYTNATYAQQCQPSNSPTIHLNGSEGSFTGVLYAPNGGVEMNGSGSGANLIGAIVADTVDIDGTGNEVFNDGRFVPADPFVGLYR